MPVDHFKMSIVANNVLCLPTKVKRYHPTSPDGTQPIRISRPLGLLRKPKQRRIITDRQFIACNLTNNDTSFNTDDEEETNADDLDTVSREDMEHNSSDSSSQGTTKNSVSSKSHRTKNKIFEQRYKIAASRTPRDDSKVRPVTSQYSKRVVYLPMFRINMERYTATQNDHKHVLSARQSLRELLHHGMKRKPKPTMVPAAIQNFHFVTPGKEPDNKEYTPRRLIFSQPISIPKVENFENSTDDDVSVIADMKAETKTQYQRFPSIGGSEDTDKMDIRIETLDLNSVNDSQQPETEIKTLPQRTGDMHHNEKDNRTTGSSYKYKLSDDYRKSLDVNQEQVGWPSYSDVKRLKQGNRKQNSALQNGITNTKSSPVLRYTSRENVLKLDPIIVPSHTNMTCPRCNIYIRERESTPCPPNSPSLNGSQEGCDEDLDSVPDHHHYAHKVNNENIYAQKPATPSKSASMRHPQELYVMPKVTVKILETREQLNEAKLNYTKNYHC